MRFNSRKRIRRVAGSRGDGVPLAVHDRRMRYVCLVSREGKWARANSPVTRGVASVDVARRTGSNRLSNVGLIRAVPFYRPPKNSLGTRRRVAILEDPAQGAFW